MSTPPNPLRCPDIFRALTFLTPYDTQSMKKVRVGPDRDGGYIMLDDLEGSGEVLSFGIGNQIGYDLVLAQKGKRVFMYDHTIDGLPYEHPNLFFRKSGIGPSDTEDANLFTLTYHIEAEGLSERDDLILKLDVEGAEYDSILATPFEVLRMFRQVIIELHDLLRLGEPEFRQQFIQFMQKMTDCFTIVHVHGNNCRPISIVDGHVVADVIELSLFALTLLRSKIRARSTRHILIGLMRIGPPIYCYGFIRFYRCPRVWVP
jgi:hypothetical protein